MARDCPDRQRGSDSRNNIPGAPPQRRIGGGDAVDREMEVSQFPNSASDEHALTHICSN